jgi:CTP synthase
VEVVELPADVHPFYVGTQAHPEFRSRPTRAHPLFRALAGAAVRHSEARRGVLPVDVPPAVPVPERPAGQPGSGQPGSGQPASGSAAASGSNSGTGSGARGSAAAGRGRTLAGADSSARARPAGVVADVDGGELVGS